MIRLLFTGLALVVGFSAEAVPQTYLTDEQLFSKPNRTWRANEMIVIESYDKHYMIGVAAGHSSTQINSRCEPIRIEKNNASNFDEKFFRTLYSNAYMKDNGWNLCLPEHCQNKAYQDALSCTSVIYAAARLKEEAKKTYHQNMERKNIECMFDKIEDLSSKFQYKVASDYCNLLYPTKTQ